MSEQTEIVLRILVLSPIELYPPNKGWSMVAFNDVVHLKALGHEIYVLAITHNPQADILSMKQICSTEYFYMHKPSRFKQVLCNLGNSLPFSSAHDLRDDYTAKSLS